MSKINTLHPVAEIHWRTVMRNFGFADPSCVERHWKSTCTNYTNVLLDPDTLVVRLLGPENTEPIAVELKGVDPIESLLAKSYRIDSRPLWRRGDLCILKLAKKLPNYPRNNAKFAIVCVDTYKKIVIGTLKLESSDGKDIMRDVEIWDGVMSPDKSVLGLSVGLIKHSHAIFEAFETFITIFHIGSQSEIKRYCNLDNIMCAVDFDPRECVGDGAGAANYVIAGVCADNVHSRCIATYGMDSDVPLKKRSVESLIDSEADNAFYISYTRDGNFLLFQVLEGLGYSDEWLYNTYIFQSDTLKLIGKLRPSMISGCHQNCTPLTKPIQSRCGDFLALPNSGKSGRRLDCNIIIYRLPCQINLMHQCRSVLLRYLKSSQDVCRVPLPQKLIQYLNAALPHDERLSRTVIGAS